MTMRASIDAVLGYLVCGFLLLAAAEAASEGTWLVERDWDPRAQVLFGSIALCGGWLVSRIGRTLLERKFVCGCLQAPEYALLLTDASRGIRGWQRILFRSYYRPIPDESRERIVDAALRDGFNEPGNSLFEFALAVVLQEPDLRRKVDRSRQFCDICRGLCAAFVVASAILIIGALWHGLLLRWSQADLRKLGYSLLCLWEALLMLHRYLKYRRQFAVDILTGYAARGVGF